MKLRDTIKALGEAADLAQAAIGQLAAVEKGNPAGATRDVAENAQIRLRTARNACLEERQQLRKLGITWCDGVGCSQLMYVDELEERPDGDLLCPDCARRELENDAEREGMARAADLFNGGGVGR